MRKKNYKGRCEKKAVPKCNEIFKACLVVMHIGMRFNQYLIC